MKFILSLIEFKIILFLIKLKQVYKKTEISLKFSGQLNLTNITLKYVKLNPYKTYINSNFTYREKGCI